MLIEQRTWARTRVRATLEAVRAPLARESLKARTIRGSFWTVAGFGLSQVIRLGGNLALTRVLAPEIFGLMALVNISVSALYLFSDLGVGTSIVQNERGTEPEFVNTAWTLQVARGFVLWLASLALAIPIARFYGEPQLVALIAAASLATIIGGFNATSLYVARREMNLRVLTLIELGSQIAAMVVMLILAYRYQSIWALVVGGLVAAGVKLAASHRLRAGPRNRPALDRRALDQLLHFGKWIFFGTAVTFLAEQVDRLALAKLISLEMLGVYGIALTFAEVPRQVTLAISGQVLFPAMSSLRDLPRPALRAKILHHRRMVLFGLAGVLVLMACFADVLIHTLYDARYAQAAWMLPLLAIGLWPRMLCNTIEPALTAVGKPSYSAIGQVARFGFTLGGILLGYALAGFVGALIAVMLNDIAYYGVINYGLWRQGLSAWQQDLEATLVLALLAVLVLAARALAGFPFHA